MRDKLSSSTLTALDSIAINVHSQLSWDASILTVTIKPQILILASYLYAIYVTW